MLIEYCQRWEFGGELGHSFASPIAVTMFK